MQNVNIVVVTGNLTRDPQLRTSESGTKVCNLRIAVNGRRKSGEEWIDTVSYFNVAAFGAAAEAHAANLKKGRPVAVEGRLDWKERGEGDDYREYVQVIANTVQYLGKAPKNDEAASEPTEAEMQEVAAA